MGKSMFLTDIERALNDKNKYLTRITQNNLYIMIKNKLLMEITYDEYDYSDDICGIAYIKYNIISENGNILESQKIEPTNQEMTNLDEKIFIKLWEDDIAEGYLKFNRDWASDDDKQKVKELRDQINNSFSDSEFMSLTKEKKDLEFKMFLDSFKRVGDFGDTDLTELIPNTISELVEVLEFYEKMNI